DAQAGWRAFNAGNPDKARQLFEKALAANASDAVALNGLGWVLLSTGNLDGAKPRFEAVLKLDPEAAGAMNGLARVHRQQGRIDEALSTAARWLIDGQSSDGAWRSHHYGFLKDGPSLTPHVALCVRRLSAIDRRAPRVVAKAVAYLNGLLDANHQLPRDVELV